MVGWETASNLAQLKGVRIDEVPGHTAMSLRLERFVERFDEILSFEDRELREKLRGILREGKVGMGMRLEGRDVMTIRLRDWKLPWKTSGANANAVTERIHTLNYFRSSS